jgi:hypothetical protein
MNSPNASILRSLAAIAAALFVAPSAVAAVAPVAPDPAQWVAQNTDIAAEQVVIAGPETVFSLQTLGPPAATGEVIALVRTESVAAQWGAAHGFRSWDAHMLFDCSHRRMRVIRSATYPEPNRGGAPKNEVRAADDWLVPQPQEPAAKLLAAACDASYAWPLRASKVAAAPAPAEARPGPLKPAPPTVVTMAAPQPQPSTPAPLKPAPPAVVAMAAPPTQPQSAPAPLKPVPPVVVATAAPPSPQSTPAPLKPAPPAVVAMAAPPPSPQSAPAPLAVAPQPKPAEALSPSGSEAGRLAVQLAHGPSEPGAARALRKARKLLGPAAVGLTDVTEESAVGQRRRYTALLSGFASADAAREACAVLVRAGRGCVVRRLADAAQPAQPMADKQANPAPVAPTATAPAPPPQHDQAQAGETGYRVQLARGPSEEGARRVLKKARKLLGAGADGLADVTEESRVGRRRRYTALLSGFPSAEAAREACAALTRAGQDCQPRHAADAAVTDL